MRNLSAAGFRLFFALVFVLAAAPVRKAGACTTVIVSSQASGSGRPLLWKQRDTDNPHNVLLHITGGKYVYTAVFNASDVRRERAFGGANEAGFAIVNNISYNLAEESYDEWANSKVINAALATCRTLADFEQLLENWPRPRNVEANFGVIDAFGGAAYFETGDTKSTRFDVEPGSWLVRSNFSISGREDEGSGMVRFETAGYLMSRNRGKFTPDFLIDGLGRSFYNYELGADISRRSPRGIAVDLDFIPRYTTVSSICIEGIGADDNPASSVIWTAIGYTPCCYAVPVWVAAGADIPVFLQPVSEGLSAPANLLAEELMYHVHPAKRDAAGKYIDFRLLRPILRAVRKAEKKEFVSGRELDREMRRSFRQDAVRRYNREAENRFAQFAENIETVLK